MKDPQLALSADDLVHHSRPSIDVLFESAADVYRSRLLGVILTGANEDGAEGLAAVHDAGGITVVQEPRDGRSHPPWCSRALKLTAPDFVLPLGRIAELLSEPRTRIVAAGGATPWCDMSESNVCWWMICEENLLALSALLQDDDVETF